MESDEDWCRCVVCSYPTVGRVLSYRDALFWPICFVCADQPPNLLSLGLRTALLALVFLLVATPWLRRLEREQVALERERAEAEAREARMRLVGRWRPVNTCWPHETDLPARRRVVDVDEYALTHALNEG